MNKLRRTYDKHKHILNHLYCIWFYIYCVFWTQTRLGRLIHKSMYVRIKHCSRSIKETNTHVPAHWHTNTHTHWLALREKKKLKDTSKRREVANFFYRFNDTQRAQVVIVECSFRVYSVLLLQKITYILSSFFSLLFLFIVVFICCFRSLKRRSTGKIRRKTKTTT